MPTILELPLNKSLQDYSEAIDRMVSKLEKIPEIISVYQIGGISSPGISDIDMVIVFDKGTNCFNNPINNISFSDKYLFIHQLYGCDIKSVESIQEFSFFHNYKLISGKSSLNNHQETTLEQKKLKKQIALEYLFKMYVNASLQKAYNILKVRSLLLHVKALKYDLEFLEVTSGTLNDRIDELMNIRHDWFSTKKSITKIQEWFPSFYEALEEFLLSQKDGFYLAENEEKKLAKNITLNQGRLAYSRKGVILPKLLIDERYYFKLLNKLNNFNFHYPYQLNCQDPIIQNYLNYRKQHTMFNLSHFPYFFPLISILKA